MLRRPVSARNFHRNSSSAAQRPTRDSPPIDAEFAHALSKRHPPRTIDRRAWPDVLPQPAGAKFFHRNSSSAAQRPTRAFAANRREIRTRALGTPSPANNRPPRTACHAAQASQRERFPSKLGERRTAPDVGFIANRRGIRTHPRNAIPREQSTAAHSLSCCTNRSVRGISIETRRAPHSARRAHSRPIDAGFARALETPSPANNRPPRMT